MTKQVVGHIVDLIQQHIYSGRIFITNGRIERIEPETIAPDSPYIIPGFIDAHVHIESSNLSPQEFAATIAVHGTLATVSDPHEIANVCGIEGVHYMFADAEKACIPIYFTAPSCVPASPFETSGAYIDAEACRKLLEYPHCVGLSEMMNYPGVEANDPEVMAKIAAAQVLNKPIDGHAPLLSGNKLKHYIQSGISTDHECSSVDEALEKLNLGMKIQLRNGSSAQVSDDLMKLIDTYPDQIMLCCDDINIIDLEKGHINNSVKRALKLCINPLNVLRTASRNAIEHYNLDIGLLQAGDWADYLVVDGLETMNILDVRYHGLTPAPAIEAKPTPIINHFRANPITEDHIQIHIKEGQTVPIIGVNRDSIETQALTWTYHTDRMHADDICKAVVINRYQAQAPAAIGLVKGFGLKKGAIASSVAHDAHHIVAVGCDDRSLVKAINSIIADQGGIATVYEDTQNHIAYPIAGLMSSLKSQDLALARKAFDKQMGLLGSTLNDPLMTMAFICLSVIPALRLTNKGLFDSLAFKYIDIFKA